MAGSEHNHTLQLGAVKSQSSRLLSGTNRGKGFFARLKQQLFCELPAEAEVGRLNFETETKMSDFIGYTSLHCAYKQQHFGYTFAGVFADSVLVEVFAAKQPNRTQQF